MSKPEPIDLDAILKPSRHSFAPVAELTIYPHDVTILLRDRLQGSSVAEAASIIGVPVDQLIGVLEGRWKPSKTIRRMLGLKTVYALTGVEQMPAGCRNGKLPRPFRMEE